MTNEENIFKVLTAYKLELEKQGYNVIYIGLYGSQNYNLDDELSDIDAKVIVMPTLHDIIFRNKTSKTIEFTNGSVDIKDIITFYETIVKGNFSYIEAMQTKYSIGDKYIKELFSKIKVNQKSLLGAMYEKRKALTHEFPSKKEEFAKWGFDPKQLHHIHRLKDILELKNNNIGYISYNNSDKNILISIKRNYTNISADHAILNADKTIVKSKEFIPVDYHYEVIDLSKEVYDYIETNMKLKMVNKNSGLSARQFRTFGNDIPKSDLSRFEELNKYKGQDISYIIYESLEIL